LNKFIDLLSDYKESCNRKWHIIGYLLTTK
jgi:hypothetical protein